ncbi:MAG: pyridoxal phosphate-dependent aminotransferase [Candidatus Binatia bacterium]|nr:pyridoxal phosphate-dependent aminotransferase [Candidatus Binatia bacterium]
MADSVKLSARTEHLRQASVLRTLTEQVSAFRDGINLGQGVCDLDMPAELTEATIASIRESRATYTPFAGVEPLRRQIAERMARRYGISYALDEIVVTIGASAALSSTFLTLLDPGDEVVLFEPFYPYHHSAALLAGARVTAIPEASEGGEPDWARLEQALGDRARILVLNTPANPGGHVWTREQLNRLSRLLDGTDVQLVTDEIYEDLIYDGRTHVPPASVPELYPRTITVSGLGKAYSITGWRLGWLAAPREIAAAIGPVFDTLCVCAPRPLQEGAARALETIPEKYYAELRDAYQHRRDRLVGALSAGGLQPRVPAGAYYMLADYRERYGEIPTRDACFRLLDELHIAAIPGEIFYSGSSPCVLRFHFAVEEPVLAEVTRRFSKGL